MFVIFGETWLIHSLFRFLFHSKVNPRKSHTNNGWERAYFTGVTILISLPTGTKIFNWLSTYLGNPPLLQLKTSSAFFGLLFLLMFTIGGSTGIILGNAAVDLGLHDTYYVVAHFHFVLSLGAVIGIFSGIIFNGEKIRMKNGDILIFFATIL